MIWSPRKSFGAVSLAVGATQRVLVMGGYHGDRGFFNDVWASDDGGVTWELFTPSAPWSERESFGLAALTVAAAGGGGGGSSSTPPRVLLVGGFNGDAKKSDVWASDDGGASWGQLAVAAPFGPRSGTPPLLHPQPSLHR